MTEFYKKEVLLLIEQSKEKLRSYNKVAIKCGVSPATISALRNNKHELIAPEMWHQIASALGYSPKKWTLAEITNYKMLMTVMQSAKRESMFMAVSHSAGSGKTATINSFAQSERSVYVIQAREWSRREFLLNLCTTLGIDAGKGYVSVDRLTNKLIKFFKDRVQQSPLLIIDEADKLKPSAMRFLIPFYNDLEDEVGVVIAGTDNLETEIKRGVRYNKKGYDELDSRFGRNFIHLVGATANDVAAICTANGISDKQKHNAIFQESAPAVRMIAKRQYKVVEDLRRVKRIIKRERIKSLLHEK